jgi:hypothetical protein
MKRISLSFIIELHGKLTVLQMDCIYYQSVTAPRVLSRLGMSDP